MSQRLGADDGTRVAEPTLRPATQQPSPLADPSAPSEARQLSELLRKTALGDESAFTSLHRLTQASVLGLCRLLLRDPQSARETAAEALEQVWLRAQQYDPRRGPPQTWILAVARNLAIDRLRSTRRSADREEGLKAAAAQPSQGFRPDDLIQRRQWSTRLQQALRALPPDQRRTVVASFLLGLSHREISRLSGQPVGTVKGRIRSGLSKLRCALIGPSSGDDESARARSARPWLE